MIATVTKKILNQLKLVVLLVFIPLVVLTLTLFAAPPKAYAGTTTSPTLGETGAYSVLAGTTVTNTGSTTTNGAVGVSPAAGVTGFPPGIAGGGVHRNDASAIAAQADNLVVYGTLNAGTNADANCTGGVLPDATDLATFDFGTGPGNIPAGLYCSAGSFLLTATATLTGSGVWVFKTVSSLITSPGSSISGGDSCNIWWRVGSSATLDTTTSFKGNIFALTSISMNTSATLEGRALAQNGQVSMQSNTVTSGCIGAIGLFASSSTSSSTSTTTACPPLNGGLVAPIIIDSRRTSSTSVFLSWGPYSGTDTFIIQYGLTNGNWQYSTNVTGFSTTIGGLPADQPIWVRIAARNNCSVGVYGVPRLIGGPLLPNTGLAPHKNSLPWYIPAGIGITILGSFVLRKRGLSSGD